MFANPCKCGFTHTSGVCCTGSNQLDAEPSLFVTPQPDTDRPYVPMHHCCQMSAYTNAPVRLEGSLPWGRTPSQHTVCLTGLLWQVGPFNTEDTVGIPCAQISCSACLAWSTEWPKGGREVLHGLDECTRRRGVRVAS